jgi:hypothetical protein
MSKYNLGDVVMIVGRIDNRIRERTQNGIVAGTIEQFLVDQQVSVILPDNEIWVGMMHEIVLLDEQT